LARTLSFLLLVRSKPALNRLRHRQCLFPPLVTESLARQIRPSCPCTRCSVRCDRSHARTKFFFSGSMFAGPLRCLPLEDKRLDDVAGACFLGVPLPLPRTSTQPSRGASIIPARPSKSLLTFFLFFHQRRILFFLVSTPKLTGPLLHPPHSSC